MPASDAQPLIQLEGITKRYHGVVALGGVSLQVRAAETLGLVGENGAGKSTLLDILSGIRRPDEGTILKEGRPVAFANPDDARRAGIFRVHQEQALIGGHTVMQNLFLGAEKRFTRLGFLDRKAMRTRAAETLSELGIALDPDTITSSLNFGARQLVEIARMVALAKLAGIARPVVLLDEPTSSLSRNDLDRFFLIVDRLKTLYGASLIFISHRMEEVLQLSDRLVILKDGKVVTDCAPNIDTAELHRLMVGRDRAADFYATGQQGEAFGDEVLALEGLTGSTFSDIRLTVRAGEIVGLGGLVQSGKTELGLSIFGAQSSRGRIAICGRDAGSMGIAERVQLGAGYVPLNRHRDGIMLGRSIRDNIALPDLGRATFSGLLDRRRAVAAAERCMRAMAIKAPGMSSLPRHLSGGNQQKVVLGKWLVRDPRLLVLDNPTRGVDAGAKEEIYRLVRAATATGCGILLISDDLVELIELSNRLYFMRGGRLSSPIEAPAMAKPAEHDVIHLMV